MAASGRAEEDEEVTLASLPIRRPSHAALGALLMAVASLWLVAAIRGSLSGSAAIIPGLGSFGAFLAAAVGLALAVFAAYWMLRRQTVVLTRGALVVTERSLLRGRAWREPLSSYREIRCQGEQRPHRYGQRNWYVVRLWHPEPGKRIELASASDPAALERQARDCARRLGLPLVWQQWPSIPTDQIEIRDAAHHARAGVRDEIAATPAPGRPLSAS